MINTDHVILFGLLDSPSSFALLFRGIRVGWNPTTRPISSPGKSYKPRWAHQEYNADRMKPRTLAKPHPFQCFPSMNVCYFREMSLPCFKGCSGALMTEAGWNKLKHIEEQQCLSQKKSTVTEKTKNWSNKDLGMPNQPNHLGVYEVQLRWRESEFSGPDQSSEVEERYKTRCAKTTFLCHPTHLFFVFFCCTAHHFPCIFSIVFLSVGFQGRFGGLAQMGGSKGGGVGGLRVAGGGGRSSSTHLPRSTTVWRRTTRWRSRSSSFTARAAVGLRRTSGWAGVRVTMKRAPNTFSRCLWGPPDKTNPVSWLRLAPPTILPLFCCFAWFQSYIHSTPAWPPGG